MTEGDQRTSQARLLLGARGGAVLFSFFAMTWVDLLPDLPQRSWGTVMLTRVPASGARDTVE